MEIRQTKSQYLGKLTVIYDGTYYLHSNYYGTFGKAERVENTSNSSHFLVEVSDRNTNYAPKAVKAFRHMISKIEREYGREVTFTVKRTGGYFVENIECKLYGE